MQTDPALESRRLTEHYRAMGDDELRELAVDFQDLTDTAQQALSAEMQSRGLGKPEDASNVPKAVNTSQAGPLNNSTTVTVDEPSLAGPAENAFGFFGRAPQIVPDTPGGDDDAEDPHEYTWKTELCVLSSREEAMQLQEVLRRAEIECWFSFGGYTTSYVPATTQSVMSGDIQVLVAADQLDQARAIAAQPIPQEIIDALNTPTPQYESPRCPKCGAEDPVLEGVDPENTWQCDQCGAQWTESTKTDGEESRQSSDLPR